MWLQETNTRCVLSKLLNQSKVSRLPFPNGERAGVRLQKKIMQKFIIVTLLLLFALPSFSQKNIQLRSTLNYGRQLSNVWGHVDSSGNEYALVGVDDGLSIVDVTNPDSISEVFFAPGPTSNWREIKTWNNHAYATNESGDGLLIVDLNFLPDSIDYSYWNADSALNSAHTLFIDENGILYLFGYNDFDRSIPFDNRGALICDLNLNPKQPAIIGIYSSDYVHDGYVRNDTLWASQISRGNFAVVDVSDKANPVVLTTQETPNRFTHNCWLSDDANYLFTTDERSGAFIASYTVSDIGNITELDRWQAAPGSGLIPHNTHVLNNYLVTSYYKYGINILDATNPAHLVEVGYYDTSPFPNSDGFQGCWGVYPYLPSGTILASDMETGLYVLTPDYQRACYLKGTATDDSTGNVIFDVSVEIMATGNSESTGADGVYKMGVADSGSYDVRFYKQGCLPKIVTGVELQSGILTTLDVALNCTTYVSAGEPLLQDEMLFSAYPTPFRDYITVYYKLPQNFSGRNFLELFSINGSLLHQLTLDAPEGEIQFTDALAKGVYVLKLKNSRSEKLLKVVKL